MNKSPVGLERQIVLLAGAYTLRIVEVRGADGAVPVPPSVRAHVYNKKESASRCACAEENRRKLKLAIAAGLPHATQAEEEDYRSRRTDVEREVVYMAAGPPSSVRAERVLRAACAAMAAAGALLLGFSAQTKTVLFIQKKAVPKDVQALWYARSLRSFARLLYLVLFTTLARSLIDVLASACLRRACQGADRSGRGGGGVPRGPARPVLLHGAPRHHRRRRRMPASRESRRVRLLPPRQGTLARFCSWLGRLGFAEHRSRSSRAVPQPFPFKPVALSLSGWPALPPADSWQLGKHRDLSFVCVSGRWLSCSCMHALLVALQPAGGQSGTCQFCRRRWLAHSCSCKLATASGADVRCKCNTTPAFLR